MGLQAPDLSPSSSTSGLLGIKRSPAGGFGALGLFQASWLTKAASLTLPGGEFQNLAEAPSQLQVLGSVPCVPHQVQCLRFLLSCRCQVIPADGVWPSIPAAACSRRAARRHLGGRIARAARAARCPGPSRTPCAVPGSGRPRPQRGSAPRPKRRGHPPAPSSCSGREVCASAPKSFSGVSPSLCTLIVGSFLPVLCRQAVPHLHHQQGQSEHLRLHHSHRVREIWALFT